MSQSPFRVGLIGFGYAGQTFHAPLIQTTPGLQLAAVASSDPDKVHSLLGPGVQACDVATLMADDSLDLIVIATPNAQHHPLARQALLAGRHVVVDKPFTLTAAQADELVALATARGRLLSVFHNRRWDSDFLAVQAVLASDQLGRPVELVAHFDRYRPQVRQRWRESTDAGAGLWMDLGPHLLDQALQLFGEPAHIHLSLATLRDQAVADDWFAAQLQWPASATQPGLRAHLQARTLAALPGARWHVMGTQGALMIDGLDPQEDALKAGLRPDAGQPQAWGADARLARLALAQPDGSLLPRTLPLPPGAYPQYYAGLREAMAGRAPLPVTPTQAARVQAWLDAGLRSAQTGTAQHPTPFTAA